MALDCDKLGHEESRASIGEFGRKLEAIFRLGLSGFADRLWMWRSWSERHELRNCASNNNAKCRMRLFLEVSCELN